MWTLPFEFVVPESGYIEFIHGIKNNISTLPGLSVIMDYCPIRINDLTVKIKNDKAEIGPFRPGCIVSVQYLYEELIK